MQRKSTIFCIVTLTLFQYETLLSVFGYKLFNRDVPNEDSFLTSTVGVSLDECISACGVRTLCNSVTYRRTAGYCRMYSTTHNDTASSTGVLYSQRTWWTQSRASPVRSVSWRRGHVEEVTCHITECPSPSAVDNSETFGNMRTIGAKLRYICIDGSVANNRSSVSTCQPDGVWNQTTLLCDMDGFNRSHVGYYTTMSTFVKGYYGTAVYNDTPRSECMSYCRNETRYCEAVSYFPQNGTCILSDQANMRIREDGWETFVKICPTSLYRGPNGRYSLTYADAVAFCISRGTTMASHADLVITYTLGYNYVLCGWVQEGNAYIALHHAIPKTFNMVGVNRCGWRTTWAVFCRNPLYFI